MSAARTVGRVNLRLTFREPVRIGPDPRHNAQSARRLAFELLGPGDRWRHSVGVAARAAEVASSVPAGDRDLLVAAAWLHDIGYAESVVDTGFHAVDGARYLDRLGWPGRLSALVAHHSGARFMAQVNGEREALREFACERSAVSDALTYADQTTGPTGQGMDIEDRLAEMLRRHGPDSLQARVHDVRAPHLRDTAARVRHRLRRANT